jgi:hypothetical protein
MFSNLSLKTKLLSGYVAITCFMVLMAGRSYFSLHNVFEEFNYISEIVVDNLKVTSDMMDNLGDINTDIVLMDTASTSDEKKKFKEHLSTKIQAQTKYNKEYEAIPFSEGEDVVWKNYHESWMTYEKTIQTYFSMASSEDPIEKSKASEFMRSSLTAIHFPKVRDALKDIWKFHQGISEKRGSTANRAFENAQLWTLVISGCGLFFATFLGYFFSSFISKKMTGIGGEISSSAAMTSSASEQLSSSSSHMSQSTSQSAAAIEETVASLEELSSMVKLNSDHAKEANSLSQRSLQSAENGEKEITRLIHAMGSMSKASKKIEEIINVIDDIAFQTNLLALNAAVEAARAGEQGKGFAVVAEAVRNLAQRSASAAKDINTLIKENVEQTEVGVKIADGSGAVLKEILLSVKKVADLNSEISAASQEQANGISQISKAMTHLDHSIQSNASVSAEVASSAEEVYKQAEALTKMTEELQSFIQGEKSVVKHDWKEPPKGPKKPLELIKGDFDQKSAASILPLEEEEAKIGKAEGF